MKICFSTLEGFKKIIWDFDEVENRATCLASQLAKQDIPEGMEYQGKFLIINNVIQFQKKYPYEKLKEEKTEPTQDSITLGSNSIFAPRSHSNSNSARKLEKHSSNSKIKNKSTSSKSLITNNSEISRYDYPKSILLDDLINEIYNNESQGETTAFLYFTPKKESAALYLKSKKSIAHPTELLNKINQIKFQLMTHIKQLLESFNNVYDDFCKTRELSNLVSKEITDYFCQAILQTMNSSSINKIPTDFQTLNNSQKELLFQGNTEAEAYFLQESLQLKIRFLTRNWLVLIDDKLDIQLSTASVLNTKTIETLKDFKLFLKKQKERTEVKELVGKISKDLLPLLIKFEQEHEALQTACQRKDELINNYYSLYALLIKIIKIKPQPLGMHLVVSEKLASLVLAEVIKYLQNSEYNHEKYCESFDPIRFLDTEIYLSPKWVDTIMALATDKDLQEKIQNLKMVEDKSINKFVSFTAIKIYKCLCVLYKNPEPENSSKTKLSESIKI